MGFAERTAEDGEVLGKDIDQAAVDLAPAGDDAIARHDLLGLHLELGGPVGDEHVVFFEAVGIEQHVEALARRQLALAVLGVDAALPAAEPRLLPARVERRDDFLHAGLPPVRFLPTDADAKRLPAATNWRRDEADLLFGEMDFVKCARIFA